MASTKALEEVKVKASVFYKAMETGAPSAQLVAAQDELLLSLEQLKSTMWQEGICTEKLLQVVKGEGNLEEIIRFKESNRVSVNSNAEAVVRAFQRTFNS